jgi:hypothetical protein
MVLALYVPTAGTRGNVCLGLYKYIGLGVMCFSRFVHPPRLGRTYSPTDTGMVAQCAQTQVVPSAPQMTALVPTLQLTLGRWNL